MAEALQEVSEARPRRFRPYPEYKDFGVMWLGEIPAHWEVDHLRRVISKFVDYRGKTPEKAPHGVPLVTAKNIEQQSIDFSLSEEFIPEDLDAKWMVPGFHRAR